MSAEFLQILGAPQLAIDLYSQQLNDKQDYNILIQRAQAYITLNQIQNAKNDLKDAIAIDSQRFEAFYQQGICDFNEGEFFSSKEYLLKSQKLIKEEKYQQFKDLLQIWLRKCEAEISRNRPQQDKNENQKINYQWFQTDQKVKITFPQVVDSKEDVKCEFKEKQVEFQMKTKQGSSVEYTFELYDAIVPEESVVELNLQKIELQLMKKEKNKNWPKLNAEHIMEEAKTFNPSSSKIKRDWDKIEKDLEKEMPKEGDPLNEMFKQIYSNGDEATRRAMIKSFQTSGGTVLSTNWNEVESKDYETKDRPKAPEGQQWNSWKQ